MSRRYFVGGNWKCNGTHASIKALLSHFNTFSSTRMDIVLFPTTLHLSYVQESLTNSFHCGAQTAGTYAHGAYTGEVSPFMLTDMNISWVILGHSERRHLMGETNEDIGKKLAVAQEAGCSIVLCVGEQLHERNNNDTMRVIFSQLKAVLHDVACWENIVIAYEPVWAIGTGLVASPRIAQEVHGAIRDWIAKHVSTDIAKKIRIIYGGSVKGTNCRELIQQDDIDGFLVGGASLKPEFLTICNTIETHLLHGKL